MTRGQEAILIQILDSFETYLSLHLHENRKQSDQLEKIRNLIKEFRNDSEYDENHKYED